jgi:hypothetical protein
MVPPDFVKQSFQAWIQENKFTEQRFYYDEFDYIEFNAVYQMYAKNMNITFAGDDLQDLREVFGQVKVLKNEMLEELKSISSFTIHSITFTSYQIRVKNEPHWIHCQEWIPLGCYKHIMVFGNIQLFVDDTKVELNTQLIDKITFPTYRLQLFRKQNK